MKNSLFKRAIATAAAVPLALTQCLNASFVSVAMNSAAPDAQTEAGQTVTLDKLLYIDPAETESTWNTLVASYIDLAESKGKSSGTINASDYVDLVAANAGQYKDLVKALAAKVVDNEIAYEIVDGDIIINGKVTQPDFNGNISNTPGQALSILAEAYNAPELNNVDFSSVKIGGTFTITIKASELNKGTDVPVEFKYTNENGTFGPGETFAYAIKSVEQIKAIGEDAIKNAVESSKTAEAIKKYDDKVDLILNKLNTAKKLYNSAKTKSVSYDSVKDAADAANAFLANHNINKTIPGSAAEIAAKATVAKAYSKALEFVNKAAAPNSVDISAAELGQFIDTLQDFNVALADSKVSVYGIFEDAEAAQVKAYYESKADDPDFGTYVESYKIFEGAANFADIDAKGGDVDVKIKRVVVTETKPVTPVETTTTGETPVETTTTGETPVETTTTGETPVETTTTGETPVETTTTEETPVETTTTEQTPVETTTTGETPVETTTTEQTPVETTTTGETPVETTTTEQTPVETTTTGETPVETTTTSVTGVKSVEVSRYATVKTTAGFYLDIEDEFNYGQIEEAILYIKTQNIAIDEEGNELKDENGKNIVLGEYTENAIDITKSVTFGDEGPSDIYDKTNTTFRYELPLYYRGVALNDEEGTPITVEAYIGVKGDADLSNEVDGSDATLILQYFGAMQAGAGGTIVDANTVQMNKINSLVTGPESIYDEFSVFLADVDSQLTDNWKSGKKNDRAIDGSDATLDLRYFGITTNTGKYGKETWNELLGGLGQ